MRDFRMYWKLFKENPTISGRAAYIAVCVAVYIISKGNAATLLLTKNREMLHFVPYALISGFAHYGIQHIVLNMWSCWILGGVADAILPRRHSKFFFIFLAAATILNGFVTAVTDRMFWQLSAGASGGIFALHGFLLMVILLGASPVRLLNPRWLYTCFGINLLATFLIPGISITGHVSGAVIGVLSGLVYAAAVKKNLGGELAGRARFRAAVRTAKIERDVKPFKHICALCGRTDTTNPELEFRYCSKCEGYKCYCTDHIYNHEHK
jgi:membrane associated rhomboid family serine protease